MLYGACEIDVDGGRLFLVADAKRLSRCSSCELIWERSAFPEGWCEFSVLNLQTRSSRTVTMKHDFASWGHTECPRCGPGCETTVADGRLVPSGVGGLLGWVGSEAGGKPVDVADTLNVSQASDSRSWIFLVEKDLWPEMVVPSVD